MKYSDFLLSGDVLKHASSWYRSVTDAKQDGPKQGLRVGIEILNKLEATGAFVKTTYDDEVTGTKNCGNTSVGMSVANEYFTNLIATTKCDPNTELQVKIVNCGSGGMKVYIYGHLPSEGITFYLDEVRSDNDSEIASPQLLKVGKYLPKNPVPIQELQRRSRLLLEKSYPDLETLVLITGPLRVHYFKADKSEQNEIYSMMKELFIGKNVHPLEQYFMKQEDEAFCELKSTCNMYDNLSKRGWLKPIKICGAIGIGGSSSQLSVFVPSAHMLSKKVVKDTDDTDSDSESESEEIFTVCYPFGMSNPKELDRFPEYAYGKLQEIGFLQVLEDYKSQGIEVAFAMKSGCALLFDNFPNVLEAANTHKNVILEVEKFKKMVKELPEVQLEYDLIRDGNINPLIDKHLIAARELVSNLEKIAAYPYHDNESSEHVQFLVKKTKRKIEKLIAILQQSTAVRRAKAKGF
jgi:hypothetical protein